MPPLSAIQALNAIQALSAIQAVLWGGDLLPGIDIVSWARDCACVVVNLPPGMGPGTHHYGREGKSSGPCVSLVLLRRLPVMANGQCFGRRRDFGGLGPRRGDQGGRLAPPTGTVEKDKR